MNFHGAYNKENDILPIPIFGRKILDLFTYL